MKKIIFLLIGVLLLSCYQTISNEMLGKDNKIKKNTIDILCSPDLYYLVKQWSKDYCKLVPELQVNVINANPSEFSEIIYSEGNLGVISDKYLKSLESKSLWTLLISREIIVPIININNPLIDKINNQGISSGDLSIIFTDPQNKNWGSLIGYGENIPLNYYLIKDESIKSEVASFLGINHLYIKGVEVNNSLELVKSVQNDPHAIGFCKLIDIINVNNHDLADNIKLLPIDNNGNGKIDHFEKIYANLNDFTRGVWIGKFPKSLINNIYTVSNGLPENEKKLAFLKWILTDGQQFLNQNGFSELIYTERQSKLEKLNDHKINVETPENQYAAYKLLLIILTISIVIIVGGLLIIAMIRKRRSFLLNLKKGIFSHPKVINEKSLIIPNGVYFDKTHTWVFMEKDGNVKVGIDDFLQHITGPLTRVKIKNPGDKVKKNEQILTLMQKGKQLNIYAPISGKIIDFNESIIASPTNINSSPFNDGWIYMIEPSNWLREINFLIMSDKYKEWIRNEFLRLKDFLAISVKTKTSEHTFALQDGGELIDNVLANLDPKVWEDFQTNFIDTSKLS
jgi:glycine cleavage system H lipoate-binding protein/ABC-type phosphate transport system substrate-binding protein